MVKNSHSRLEYQTGVVPAHRAPMPVADYSRESSGTISGPIGIGPASRLGEKESLFGTVPARPYISPGTTEHSMISLLHITATLKIPESEITYRFSRSAGPGGQNVNKVSSRVELLFDLGNSPSLSEGQRSRITEELGSKIGGDGILRVSAQASRSQWQNRQDARERFVAMLKRALAPRKKRHPTQPTFSSRERRVRQKKLRSVRKKGRGGLRSREIDE